MFTTELLVGSRVWQAIEGALAAAGSSSKRVTTSLHWQKKKNNFSHWVYAPSGRTRDRCTEEHLTLPHTSTHTLCNTQLVRAESPPELADRNGAGRRVRAEARQVIQKKTEHKPNQTRKKTDPTKTTTQRKKRTNLPPLRTKSTAETHFRLLWATTNNASHQSPVHLDDL